MEQYKKIIKQCERFSSGLSELESHAFQWSLRSQSAAGDITDLLDMEMDPKNRFPKEWHTIMAISRAFSYVFSAERQARKFLSCCRKDLSPSAEMIVSHLINTPMKWTAFTMDGKIDDALYSITDVLDGHRPIGPLYLDSVKDTYRDKDWGDTLFIALLVDNGLCLQPAGLVHQYLCVTPKDLDFLGYSLDDDLYEVYGLTGIINTSFLDFFRIDEIAPLTPAEAADETDQVIWRQLHLENIGITELPGAWDVDYSPEGVLKLEYIEADEELRSMELLDSQNPGNPWVETGLFAPTLFLVPEDHTACIYASSIHDYTILLQALKTRFEIKQEDDSLPFFRITPIVWALVETIPYTTQPWQWCTELFTPEYPAEYDEDYEEDMLPE